MHFCYFIAAQIRDDLSSKLTHCAQPLFVIKSFEDHIACDIWMGQYHESLNLHGHDGLINYYKSSVPLGRRFRVLKLWFLLRSYRLKALRVRLRNHVEWSEELAKKLGENPQFEIVTTPTLSLFTFCIAGRDNTAQIEFVNCVNDDGWMYITQTKVDEKITIRFQIGQFDVTEADIIFAYDVMCELAA